MNLVDLSGNMLLTAFFLYCIAFICYFIAVSGKKWSNRDPKLHEKRWGSISFTVSSLGLLAHLLFFSLRWAGSGVIPVSNMYEFINTLAMAIMIAHTVFYFLYRKTIIGMFTMPLTIIVVAYASVFPQEVQPLIPALNSIWLKIHVTMAVLGEAFFAIGFAAGLMYLLRVINFSDKSKQGRRAHFWLEFCLYSIVVVVGFIVAVFTFNGMGYEAIYTEEKAIVDGRGNLESRIETVTYTMPPIVKPFNGQAEEVQSFLGMKEAWFEAPSWMNGVNAARKLNTVIWSIITGSLLYGLYRLIARRSIAKTIHPALSDVDPDDLDEISYRAIAIGFPIFTLGALIFAMIWAEIAWGRFWGWDPKEVWALVTWLFYSAYLHFRLSRGWQGYKSAWLAVIGFVVVLFTLVGVNLIIAGLHSYAGV